MDIGERMCYGECCEVCKPGDSETCAPGANNTIIHYMLIEIINNTKSVISRGGKRG